MILIHAYNVEEGERSVRPIRRIQMEKEIKKNMEVKEIIKEETFEKVNGGAAKSAGWKGGYCAQAPDRTCHVEEVGQWSPGNEICDTCGWRAW